MKRAFSLLLTLALLALGASALGEWQYPTEQGTWILGSKPVSIDLDGDGTQEAVSCAMVPTEYDAHLQLKVTGSAEAVFDTGIINGNPAWIYDLDGDGAMEIFLWGDEMSDDYITFCLHWVNGRLVPVLFADTTRGEGGEGYYKSGYGMLEDVDTEAGTVTLCGSQDALGTYFMSRTLALSEDGLFELADDGRWVRDLSGMEDDAWEYGGLTLKASVACEIDGQAMALEPGEKLMITATDKSSFVEFVTQDGREGRLAISRNYIQGWGWLVEGIPEEEIFESVPYAD